MFIFLEIKLKILETSLFISQVRQTLNIFGVSLHVEQSIDKKKYLIIIYMNYLKNIVNLYL
jgi:hypothetical protein